MDKKYKDLKDKYNKALKELKDTKDELIAYKKLLYIYKNIADNLSFGKVVK